MNTIFFKTLHKKLYCFIALFLVAVLGSGLFLSLFSLPDAVETSLNNYINDSNLMDVKITSTIGFSSADASAVRMMDGVDAVMPVSTVNAFMSVGDKDIKSDNGQKATAKVSSLDVELVESDDKSNINRLELISGRFPENDEECVVDASACDLKGIDVGSKITLAGDGSDIFTSLSKNTFTVVGTVDVPTYLTKNLGTETVGSGHLNALVYVMDSVFVTDSFTEIYVRLSGLQKYNYTGDEYFSAIQKFSEEALALGDQRLESRAELVAAIAKEEIARDREELDAYSKSFEKELKASKQKLDEIKDLATDGDTKIAEKEAEVENSISEDQKKILARKEEFVKTSDQYIADLAQYNLDRETYSQEREAFVENFDKANSNLPEQEEKLEKVKAEMTIHEKKVALNQQVVDSYTDPSKMPNFDELLANAGTNGLDAEFIKYMKRCANDTSKTLGQISLSQQQLEYAAKKLEFTKVSSTYNDYRNIVDNYDANSANLQAKEEELKARQAELEERKVKIEQENVDILTGENAISNETFDLKLELAELKIKITDAKKNKDVYEKEYAKIEKDGNEKIENLNRSLESNEILINNTDAATWDIFDVRSIQGYESLSATVATVSSVSKIPAILALVLTAVICVLVMLKYARSEAEVHEKLALVGTSRQTVSSSYLLVYIPIYILSVLSGVAFTTYILPSIVKGVLDVQYTIPSIDIPVPVAEMIIAAVVLAVIVPVVFSVIFLSSRFRMPKNKKDAKTSALRKRNFITTITATAMSLILFITSGGILLENYVVALAGPAKAEGIVYDAIADLSFPMETADKAIFANTPVKESLFARRYTVTGAVSYDLYVIQDAKSFSKFIFTGSKLTDNGVIISKDLSKDFGKKAGDVLQLRLPDGTKGNFKIIGISGNSVQPIMYMTEKTYEQNFKMNVTYNCAFLNFGISKLSVDKIDENIMKNAAVSKVTSTEAIDEELSLNNNISNTVLVSVCVISLLWSILSFVALFTADIRKKKNYHV